MIRSDSVSLLKHKLFVTVKTVASHWTRTVVFIWGTLFGQSRFEIFGLNAFVCLLISNCFNFAVRCSLSHCRIFGKQTRLSRKLILTRNRCVQEGFNQIIKDTIRCDCFPCRCRNSKEDFQGSRSTDDSKAAKILSRLECHSRQLLARFKPSRVIIHF